jgi:4-hydroxy-tetrahydrodipicolinate synthase
MDAQAVRRLGRRQIDNGTHFLVPIGTTGENPTLETAERIRMVEILVDEAKGQVPVLAGCGGYNTKEVVHLAKAMQKAGADGLLSVTPYYNKPTQEGLVEHFKAIAGATPLPIMLYNIAGRTGLNIETPTVARLAQVPNIIGVKEASGSLSQMCDVLRSVPPEFLVLSGDDALTLPLMAVGGRGVISVVSNQINFIEGNPGPVKYAMAAMGLLEEVFRLPIVSPKPESKAKVDAVLKELGLLKAALV